MMNVQGEYNFTHICLGCILLGVSIAVYQGVQNIALYINIGLHYTAALKFEV